MLELRHQKILRIGNKIQTLLILGFFWALDIFYTRVLKKQMI